MDLSPLLSSLPSAFLGGVVAAFLNYLFTRKKIQTEIQKNELEIQQLQATMTYVLPSIGETIVYPGRDGIKPADFRGSGDARFNSPKGEGALTVDGGILRLHRTNTAGRFVVALERYYYHKGQEVRALPKNELLSGGRKLRLQCDVKTVGGEHTLVFAIREDIPKEEWLAQRRERVTRDEWIPINGFFRVPSHVSCYLWIEDRSVSKPNSSVLIRNLVLAERND